MRRLPRLPRRTPRPVIAGRTRWRHFTGLLAAALTVLTVMVIGVFQGVLPVSAALRGKQNIKLSIQNVTGYATGSFPKFFQNRDGKNNAVVVIGLRQVNLQGLCASGKVDTPLGPYVMRFTSPPTTSPIKVGDLQMALENIEHIEIAGGQAALNRDATTSHGIPKAGGPSGTLPIKASNLKLTIRAKVNWLTVSGISLSGINMTTGRTVKECF